MKEMQNVTGDIRDCFNPEDVRGPEKAEKRFKELIGRGFTAAVCLGEVSNVRSFDPTAGETLFFPRLVGG